jgi:hypothetical protein
MVTLYFHHRWAEAALSNFYTVSKRGDSMIDYMKGACALKPLANAKSFRSSLFCSSTFCTTYCATQWWWITLRYCVSGGS